MCVLASSITCASGNNILEVECGISGEAWLCGCAVVEGDGKVLFSRKLALLIRNADALAVRQTTVLVRVHGDRWYNFCKESRTYLSLSVLH
jgi:hypothetical protein